MENAAGLGQIHSKSAEILNVRAAVTNYEHRAAAVVQRIGFALGRPALFLFLVAACIIWMFANLRDIPWWQPWDPYPFAFLATLASAFGPFLTLLVLMYQRRNSKIADVRQELALQVALHLKRQMSVTIRLLRTLQESAAAKGVRTRSSWMSCGPRSMPGSSWTEYGGSWTGRRNEASVDHCHRSTKWSRCCSNA